MSLPELASPESVGISSARLARLHRYVTGLVENGRLVGASALVARRGRMVYLHSAGLRDREAGLAMGHDTVVRIFSMTKPITTVAALMLFEDGQFLLDDPVSKFLPAFAATQVCVDTCATGPVLAPPRRPMTIKDLMTHTAGLTYGWYHDTPVDALFRARQPAAAENDLATFVDAVASLPLCFHPGESWRYSVATDVLGRLVEVVAGKPLDEFFADEIFRPLGMADTGFWVPAEQQDRLAALYSPFPSFDFAANMLEILPADAPLHLLEAPADSPRTHRPALLSGGGGLVSTLADYYRFTQMLLNGGVLDGVRLLGRKTVHLMTMNHLPPSLVPIVAGGVADPGVGFGLGGSVVVDVAATGLPISNGLFSWGGAASTSFWIDPAEELLGLFVTQLIPNNTMAIHKEMRRAVYQALVD